MNVVFANASSGDDAAATKRRDAKLLFERHAEVLVAEGAKTYGFDSTGIFAQSGLTALTDTNAQNFRLDEFPALIDDPSYLSTPKSILDLGCGTAPYVHQALLRGHDAHGIDLDVNKIRLARLKVDMHGYADTWREHTIVADAGALPYPNETFDLVTSYTALEHMHDIPAVLYESVRVTRIGGFIECLAPDYRGPYDTHYGMAWPSMMPRRQAERWCLAMDRPVDGIDTFVPITLPQIEACFESLGCVIVHASLMLHTPTAKLPFDGNYTASPLFADDRHIERFARSIRTADAAGTLELAYRAALVFTLVVRRVR